MNFDNLIDKKIRNCFVPADKMSITFVMESGHRRSIGAQNAGGTRVPFRSFEVPPGTDGATFTGPSNIDGSFDAVLLATSAGNLLIAFSQTASLVELPE